MQAVLANKLPVHPSVPVTLPVPASTRGRITCPELRVLDIYVAMLLRGTHKEKRNYVRRGDIYIQYIEGGKMSTHLVTDVLYGEK